jgi:putative transcriptional regulator
LVGVTRQTILLIEKDSFNPSIQLCISIAKALDTTLDGLFWNKEQRIHEESHHDS